MEQVKEKTENKFIFLQDTLESLFQNPDSVIRCLLNGVRYGEIGEKEVERCLLMAKANPNFKPFHLLKMELVLLELKESALLLDQKETMEYLKRGTRIGNLSQLEKRYQDILAGFQKRKELLVSKLAQLEQKEPKESFRKGLRKRR